MTQQTILNRTVFDKEKFNQTVDTQFSQLIDRDQPVPFDINTATVADFFALYNRFFYEIPKQGDINSHYYLVETSGEYINFNKYQAEIQELLQEITDLRSANLELISSMKVDASGYVSTEALNSASF